MGITYSAIVNDVQVGAQSLKALEREVKKEERRQAIENDRRKIDASLAVQDAYTALGTLAYRGMQEYCNLTFFHKLKDLDLEAPRNEQGARMLKLWRLNLATKEYDQAAWHIPRTVDLTAIAITNARILGVQCAYPDERPKWYSIGFAGDETNCIQVPDALSACLDTHMAEKITKEAA